MSIPAPGTDEDATPVYGIRKPKPSQKAKWIWRAIGRIADDFEAALALFGLPPVVSSNTVVASSSAARDAYWGVPANATARLALQTLGATTIRTDKGWTEQYFAAQDDGGVGTNPSGMRVAGWYRRSTPRHAEFSATSASAASGAVASVGALARTAAASNDSLFATIAANVITVTEAGIYALDGKGDLPASPTGLYWVQVVIGGAGTYKIYGSTASGRVGGPFFANLQLAAGATITIEFFHQSAASRVLTSAFALSRIG